MKETRQQESITLFDSDRFDLPAGEDQIGAESQQCPDDLTGTPPFHVHLVSHQDLSAVQFNDLLNQLRSNDITRFQPVLLLAPRDIAEQYIIDHMQLVDWTSPSSDEQTIALRKRLLVNQASAAKRQHTQLTEASDIAFLAMSTSSALGEVTRFIQESFSCHQFSDLFELLDRTVAGMGFDHILACQQGHELVFHHQQSNNPQVNLENLIKELRGEGRMVHIGASTLMNYPEASILFIGLPIDEPDRYGQLLDTLQVLSEAAAFQVKAILTEQRSQIAEKAKAKFLANMSHELRTPLNSIAGFSSRLVRKLKGKVTDSEFQSLDAIRRNADRLKQVISNILDITQLESNSLVLAPENIDLAPIIEDVTCEQQEAARQKSLPIHTQLEGELLLYGDAIRLRQVISNLLSNAIHYTDSGEIRVHGCRIHDPVLGDSLAITIADTGIGIAEKNRKKLFRYFSQVDDSLARKVEGAGLGLALSNAFVKLHQGRIEVRSEEGEGTEFSVILPVMGPATETRPSGEGDFSI